MTRAVVVGSGPNGLAAAITLAAAGCSVTVLEASDEIGGGTRSGETTSVGVLHDECSGFHPLATDTAFSREFRLAEVGLQWAWPDVQYAHPLDGARGAAAVRAVDATAAPLGLDAPSYRRLFGPLTSTFDRLAPEILQPALHVPRSPVPLVRLGLFGALPATALARRWRTEEARALWAGVAAHAFRPLGSLASSAIGLVLGAAAHRHGWPVAVGGSQSISAAMTARLRLLGGTVETGVRVGSYDEIRDADVVLLDTSPTAARAILGRHLPARIGRAYGRFRHGPAAFQVALAVDGGIPWSYEPARQAGTVHVGGTMDEIAHAERALWRGSMPERPFVLVGQQYLADPSRSSGSVHPVDTYAHVPAGWHGDATEHVLRQLERFAPGVRERIVATAVRGPSRIERDNANFVGGDIITGANTPRQLILRPRATLTPYATGVPGVFLCSAATPPGAGAHGMCGYHAARAALASLAR